MTLDQLLEIKKNLLFKEEEAGLLIGELIWVKNGSPRGAMKLARVLDAAIEECRRMKTTYPPVFLKRLKELQRGTWKPCATKIIGIDGKSIAERSVAT